MQYLGQKKDLSQSWQGLEPLESRLLLSTDLTLAIGALPGGGADIPTGYLINVPVTVTNNNQGPLSGTGTLTVSFDDGINPPMEMATKTISSTIAPGGHADFVIPCQIPVGAAIGVDTLSVTAVIGVLTSNVPTATPNITWDFGNIPGLGNVPLTAIDPATGEMGVFSLAGPGMGSLTAPRSIWDMNLTGTTRATKVTVTGAVDLEQIRAAAMVGGINAPAADFTAANGFEGVSFMTFAGGLLSLTMHDSSSLAAEGHAVAVGNGDFAKDALAIKFNNANDLDLDSRMPISFFTAANYATHVGNPEIHTTAYIGSVVITGNFTGINGESYPEISAEGANPASGFGIASIKVGGNMDSSQFYSYRGKVGPVQIGGFMDNGAEVYAEFGSIGNVSVGGYMDNDSEIYNNYGGIGSVRVGGNVDHGSYIEVGTQGNIGAVWIGGNLDNSSEIYVGDHGNIASVKVGGNVDNSAEIYISERGNIGPVTIGGNLDHSAQVYLDYGNIAGVKVTGNVDNEAEIYISDYGKMGPVAIGGNVDNGAEVYSYKGDIASVKVGGNVDHGAYIETGSAGDLGPVTIGGNLDNNAYVETGAGDVISVKIAGNLDHGAEVYADYGDILSVTVGGNLDNSAEVYASQGNIGNVRIGRNFDNGARVYCAVGSVGVGAVLVGGDFSHGAQVYAYGAAIKSVKVLGDSLWTGGNGPKVYASTTIGSIAIGGRSLHADFEAGGSIGSISVGGVMQGGLINCYQGGNIGSITVGQLDGTTIQTGVSGNLAGNRDDFTTQNSSIGKIAIKGIKTNDVYNYITGGSQILVWHVGSIACGGSSVDGDGLIEFHTGSVGNLPDGVTETVVA